MNFCFVINHNYIGQLKITLYSLYEHHKDEDISIYVFSKDLTEKDKENLNAYCNKLSFKIDYLLMSDELFKNCSHMANDKAGYTTYYKLYILALLNHLDRVLYLDCDMIINKSLKEFYNGNYSKFLIAVKDREIMMADKRYIKKLTGSRKTSYFNAGMLLFNFYKGYEKDIKMFEEIEKYLNEESSSLKTHDQDVFNHFFKDNVEFVSNSYNFFAMITRIYQLFIPITTNRNPHIIHYVAIKPWSDSYYGFFYKKYLNTYNKAKEITDVDFLKKRKFFKSMKTYFIMWRTRLHRTINWLFRK